MARARNIKPGFFSNDELVELPFEVRLLFIGLWTIADREGRLEDRPKKIKMEIFPADSVDCEQALTMLAASGFIERYEVGGKRYIQVVNWGKHQNPHIKEAASTIPAPGQAPEIPVQVPDSVPAPAQALVPALDFPVPAPDEAPPSQEQAGLIPDSGSLIPDTPTRIPDVMIPGEPALAATSHLLNATTGEENPRPVQLAILLRKTYGMTVTSNHADVIEMVRLAVSDQEIAEAVEVFGMKKPGDKPNAGYILGMIRTAREQAAKAAAAAAGKPAGPAMPTQAAAEWWNCIEGIKAKAAELSLVWKEGEGELFMSFKVRVFKRAGEGPWRQQLLRETECDEAMHARILAFFYPSEQEAA
ncbi:hypothetical protein [Cupriavidus sp. BIC8F]|uniref:hypothetical protein n=1 Tax=Cupriavidus sp. BIC8F TaxID=3079014 RepID=UPI002916A2F3|nr:hypothetical protein [Cupriavidus sp. BIC8F]